MPRPRTRELTKKEMSAWISGYNKGLQAGLTAVSKQLRAVRSSERINKKDSKDIARKFK
ncbi:MAG: hypothetical protein ACUVV6_07290 [Thermoplasmatota archaeon]